MIAAHFLCDNVNNHALYLWRYWGYFYVFTLPFFTEIKYERDIFAKRQRSDWKQQTGGETWPLKPTFDRNKRPDDVAVTLKWSYL